MNYLNFNDLTPEEILNKVKSATQEIEKSTSKPAVGIKKSRPTKEMDAAQSHFKSVSDFKLDNKNT